MMTVVLSLSVMSVLSAAVADSLSHGCLRTHDLGGSWMAVGAGSGVVVPANVPGSIHGALLRAGKIQDPHFRFNDLHYRWIAYENWTFYRNFSFSGDLRRQQKVVLVFDSIDTVAKVSLNGRTVGHTNNMFITYRFDVMHLLLLGSNEISVAIESAPSYAARQNKAHTSYPVPPACPPPEQHGECHANFIRKTQTSFGWDWAPAFATQGVRLGVRLETFAVAALEQLSITTHLESHPEGWQVAVVAVFDVASPVLEGSLLLEVPALDTIGRHNFSLTQSASRIEFVIPITQNDSVKLWWPQGEGDRPGYDVTVIFKLDQGSIIQRNVKVYFRTVELVQQTVQGSPGLSFYLRINSRPVFLRGANWVPADSFLERVTRQRLQNLLQSVVDANMNALRVFGGGIYEQSIFYSLCDELGIMVIQDFMFACALYPTEPTFLELVRNEISQQVLRLSSHPSIVMWVSNNENEVALAKNWFDIPLHLAPHYRSDYISLYIATLRNVILQEDKSRPFLPSSPTNGVESKREGWLAQNPYDTHYGDVHYYNYTADCWDWQTFPCARFLSEFGYQSWPSFSSVAEVSLPEDWQLNSSFCNIRQHQTHGNKYILHQIHQNYPIPVTQNPLRSFQLILYLSQVSQAQCVKMQVEFYRRSRNEVKNGEGWTMGALYWQLNDVWQAPSWSSLEYSGKWKMLHYFAKDFFAPVVPILFEDEEDLLVYAVSELNFDLKLMLKLTVYHWDSFQPACHLNSSEFLLHARTSQSVLRRPLSTLLASCADCSPTLCLLTAQLMTSNGIHYGQRNSHFPVPLHRVTGLHGLVQVVAVNPAGLQRFTVVLKASAVSPFVFLDAGTLHGRFEDNGFLMVEPVKNVIFQAWQETTAQELKRKLTVTSLSDVFQK